MKDSIKWNRVVGTGPFDENVLFKSEEFKGSMGCP